MTKYYGHKWITNYGESDEGNLWMGKLTGLTPKLLTNGVRLLDVAFKSWPPTVFEFKELCLGIRNNKSEISNAIHGKIKTPLGKIIYNLVGHWDMTTQRSSYLEKRCNEVYDAAVSKFVIGKFAGIYKSITNGDRNE